MITEEQVKEALGEVLVPDVMRTLSGLNLIPQTFKKFTISRRVGLFAIQLKKSEKIHFD